jgi:AraC-like DNA-binding protein
MPPPTEFSPTRYSYSDLPERDRAAVWCEVVGRKVFRSECEPLGDAPFRAEITHRGLPGLGIVSIASSGQRLTRSPELIADGSDLFWLSITRSGAVHTTQRGRDVTVGEGEATLISYTDPLTLVRPVAGQSLGFLIPFKTLAPLVRDIDEAVMRPIPRDTEALRLLTGYLGLLDDDFPLASAELRHAVISHIQDLVVLAVGATRDASAMAEGRGLRAARLRAIKADILGNLARAELTIGWLASRHHLNPRYIQRLFETDGTTFSQFLLDRRLTLALRLLSDPLRADRSITSIAFECGFHDLSYFNRCIRRRYGEAPSHLRGKGR